MPSWCNGSALDTTDVSVGVRVLSGVPITSPCSFNRVELICGMDAVPVRIRPRAHGT